MMWMDVVLINIWFSGIVIRQIANLLYLMQDINQTSFTHLDVTQDDICNIQVRYVNSLFISDF